MKRSEHERLKAAVEKAEDAYEKGRPIEQRECFDSEHQYGLQWELVPGGTTPYRLKMRSVDSYGGARVTREFLARAAEVLQALERWAADEGDWPLARKHEGCGGRFR
jgi:hypothetical protein